MTNVTEMPGDGLTPETSDDGSVVELDVRGLNCPMPLLKAKLALNDMASGQHLRVRATDPGSERDFAVFSEQSGHVLVNAARDGEVYTYVLRRK